MPLVSYGGGDLHKVARSLHCPSAQLQSSAATLSVTVLQSQEGHRVLPHHTLQRATELLQQSMLSSSR